MYLPALKLVLSHTHCWLSKSQGRELSTHCDAVTFKNVLLQSISFNHSLHCSFRYAPLMHLNTLVYRASVKIVNGSLQLLLKKTVNSLAGCYLELDRGYLECQLAALWVWPACISLIDASYFK